MVCSASRCTANSGLASAATHRSICVAPNVSVGPRVRSRRRAIVSGEAIRAKWWVGGDPVANPARIARSWPDRPASSGRRASARRRRSARGRFRPPGAPSAELLEVAPRAGADLPEHRADLLGVEEHPSGRRARSALARVVLPTPNAPLSMTIMRATSWSYASSLPSWNAQNARRGRPLSSSSRIARWACQPPETSDAVLAPSRGLEWVRTRRTASPSGISSNVTSNRLVASPSQSEAEQTGRIDLEDRAGRGVAVLHRLVLLGRRLGIVVQLAVLEAQIALPPGRRSIVAAREPAPPLLRLDQVGPDPLDGAGKEPLEADGVGGDLAPYSLSFIVSRIVSSASRLSVQYRS